MVEKIRYSEIFYFRHRHFWDGGVHCITQDLYREGTQEDYQ
jgi:hypothetical protein